MALKEHPRYSSFEWEDYEFREYPMAIYPGSSDGGKTPDPDPRKPGKFLQETVIVNSEEERRQVLGIEETVATEAPFKPTGKLVSGVGGAKRLETEADAKEALLQEAENLGVQVDGRWSVARIQDAIDTHKAGEVV